jgi:hypothetical protein
MTLSKETWNRIKESTSVVSYKIKLNKTLHYFPLLFFLLLEWQVSCLASKFYFPLELVLISFHSVNLLCLHLLKKCVNTVTLQFLHLSDTHTHTHVHAHTLQISNGSTAHILVQDMGGILL